MRLHHKLEQEEHGQDVHSNAHLTIVSATKVYEDIAQVTQYYAVGDTVGEWHEQNADECRYGFGIIREVNILYRSHHHEADQDEHRCCGCCGDGKEERSKEPIQRMSFKY